MRHINHGTCSRSVSFDIVEDKVTEVSFENGCNGNLKGIGKLVEGMQIDEAIARLKGIQCGEKGTSCPDQLAEGLEQYKKQRQMNA